MEMTDGHFVISTQFHKAENVYTLFLNTFKIYRVSSLVVYYYLIQNHVAIKFAMEKV